MLSIFLQWDMLTIKGYTLAQIMIVQVTLIIILNDTI